MLLQLKTWLIRQCLLTAGLIGAVAALRVALRERGSDLLVRVGPVSRVISDAAAVAGVSAIVTEDECEHRQGMLPTDWLGPGFHPDLVGRAGRPVLKGSYLHHDVFQEFTR